MVERRQALAQSTWHAQDAGTRSLGQSEDVSPDGGCVRDVGRGICER